MREALAAEPENTQFLARYAWAFFASSPDMNATMAQSHLRTASRAAPELVDARVFLGRISEFLGEYDEALRLYRTVLDAKNAPPSFIKEAEDFEQRLAEAREEAKAAELELDIVDLLNEDLGMLFRRWMRNV